MAAPSRVVALLSGGMDSAVAAAIAKAEGAEVHALAVDYGQRSHAELDASRRVAAALGLASWQTVRVDLGSLGGSALTDDAVAVPKDRDDAEIGRGIPPTYVPARNTVFLAIAFAAAEALCADAVTIGVNALDTSGYPDCRPGFLDAMRRVAAEGTKRGAEGQPLEILAPLMELTKGGIVERGLALAVPFGTTLSCYDPVAGAAAGEHADAWLHCGRCDACRLRARGFAEAGAEDPAPRAGPTG